MAVMTRYFSAVSVSAMSIMSAIAWGVLAMPAIANDKAYSELMLRSLVEMCVKEQPKGLLVPFAREGVSAKTLPTIMGEYRAIVTQSIQGAEQTQLV